MTVPIERAQALRDAMPTATLYELAATGHLVFVDHLEQIVAALRTT